MQVIFIPEKIITPVLSWGDASERLSYASKGLTRGGTGLSGTSNQKFGVASEIDLDQYNVRTITFKLVCKEDDDIQPLKSSDQKLSKEEFRVLFQSTFNISQHEAKARLQKLAINGVIDPLNLTKETIEVIRNHYLGDW